MPGDDGYFDEGVAARYDESSAEMFDPAVVEPVVDLLAELAGDGRALELGIGTGRIALPLARRGVPVQGIELSQAMVERLREKPGGEEIDVTIGDFATTTVDGTFSVARGWGSTSTTSPIRGSSPTTSSSSTEARVVSPFLSDTSGPRSST